MKPTRKLWVSGAVVAAILTGGISVAAAATGDPAENPNPPRNQPENLVNAPSTTYPPGKAPGQVPGPVPPEALPTGPPKVSQHDMAKTPEDARKVIEYWMGEGGENLEDAEPMPMPSVILTPPPKKSSGG
ncbi:hypothetical protein [Bailinhaonella thermotolerans]|uniref:Uncharacterized protein n=1 Tax=Bailinhaonella thermotolerans TaxID=1070861 RepID=A0A3A4AD09_9ACTN|nr:hypothetical protein [Bailinhaonella thermotolerans]RJL27196.1 hypothetical protein D5H75_25720 [Bailinhaonella thermotolerans]